MIGRMVVVVLGLVLALLPPASRAASTLTVEECQRWLSQLRAEAAGADITGDGAEAERTKLLERVDEAKAHGQQAQLGDSRQQVTKFRERAAALAADGKVSRVQGERLKILSDTASHCLERVETTK